MKILRMMTLKKWLSSLMICDYFKISPTNTNSIELDYVLQGKLH